MKEILNISEIFFSLQGESDLSGLPTVFIRLAGCPMRCRWCDTTYAFKGEKKLTIAQIIAELAQYQNKRVCVTGGEPLAQKESLVLIKTLCDLGYATSVETGGMLDIGTIDKRTLIVLDIKAPSSGENKNNYWPNLKNLPPHTQIKYVIASKDDYIWVKNNMAEYNLYGKNILLSPVADQINPTDLANWILQDRLDVRFQLQLHKIIWGDLRGR